MREEAIAAYGSARLVEDYVSLVTRIARHLFARMPPSVQLDDLIQAGMVGLLEADGKYDSSKGASFETYAGIRIRGAIIDEIRRGDWAPRSIYRNARRISESIRSLEAKTGREAVDRDVARDLGMKLDDYFRAVRDASGCALFSYEELQASDEDACGTSGANTSEQIENQELISHLAQAIDRLPERERLIVSLYYNDGLNLKEIGLVIHVGESRVSQLLSRATLKLRAHLHVWLQQGE